MIVINYGLYDLYGELAYAAVTHKTNTALDLMKADLDEYLQSEIEEAGTHNEDTLIDLTNTLIELGKITTIDEFIANEFFHYEEWKVSGINDKEV